MVGCVDSTPHKTLLLRSHSKMFDGMIKKNRQEEGGFDTMFVFYNVRPYNVESFSMLL